ncbi:hypothetical protein IVB27_13350 [Bradyrhizobium sp. 197]|jgi:hypothetical protein|uniref:hypothetical protein n=1 Tax=Bradyrhizobium sp. 197 TaxID=2782663 RepID=UPI001FF7D33C|nr:hypothetical protein [Bradyrhizobium sp. 197]MCK1475767.1 hypothetical protein [Bradyrhizobium sp. 197]
MNAPSFPKLPPVSWTSESQHAKLLAARVSFIMFPSGHIGNWDKMSVRGCDRVHIRVQRMIASLAAINDCLRSTVPTATLPRRGASVSAAPAAADAGNRSFTAKGGSGESRQSTKRRWRERPGLQAARFNSAKAVHIVLHEQGFPARLALLLSARLPKACGRRGVVPVWPKNAVACGRTTNFSSISVLARRMKLTGP